MSIIYNNLPSTELDSQKEDGPDSLGYFMEASHQTLGQTKEEDRTLTSHFQSLHYTDVTFGFKERMEEWE